MAKGLCPGVGQSCKTESVEKRGRERERERGQYSLGFMGTNEGPPEEVLKARVGK